MAIDVIKCVEIKEPSSIMPIFLELGKYIPLDFSPLVSFNPVVTTDDTGTSQTNQVEILMIVTKGENETCDLGIKINDWKEEIEGVLTRKIGITCSTLKPTKNSVNKKICIIQFEYTQNVSSQVDKSIYVCCEYITGTEIDNETIRGTVTTSGTPVSNPSKSR